MKTARIGGLAGLAVAGVLGAGLLAVPAASAQTAPPTLNGETLDNHGISGPGECSGSGSTSFTVTGTAAGPYAGTYSETVSATVNGTQLTSYSAAFTITSATGDVSGTEQLGSSPFACYDDAVDFQFFGTSVYQAAIQTNGGTYTDQGTTEFLWFALEDGASGGPYTAPGGTDAFTSSLSQVTPVTQDTATTVASSADPSVAGQPVTYTAAVSPVPGGGTVAFTDGGVVIAGCGAVAVDASTGTATCPVAYKSAGSHVITAAYSGTAGYAASTSASLTQDVVADRADLKVKLSVPSSVADGSGVTETVTVTNQGPAAASKVGTALTEAGGLSVTSADGASVRGPVLTWTTPSLAPGASVTYTVTAQVGARAKGIALVAAGALSATPDPDLLNNAALATIRLG